MRELKFRIWSPKYRKFWYIWIGQDFVFKKTDIIEQFTGFHDKNGKEIYEGDILECSHGHFIEVYFGRHDSIDGWLTKGKHHSIGGLAGRELEDPNTGWIIAGNIHENKELLK